jgi:hypothetical protein
VNADVLSSILREPGEIARRCEKESDLRELASWSLLCLVFGAALFGGVMGSFRGGPQIAYSAIKLPLALLATLVATVPAFFAVAVALGQRARFVSVAALSLTASARGALVLAGAAPVLWLSVDRGLSYHQAVMLAVAMYMASGLAALGIVLRGLGGSVRALITAAACSVVFFGVLGQTAWMLRPFFGRPAQASVPFVRAREGSFADSVARSTRSAAGIFDSPSTIEREY